MSTFLRIAVCAALVLSAVPVSLAVS